MRKAPIGSSLARHSHYGSGMTDHAPAHPIADASTPTSPPMAQRKPHSVTHHGRTLIDDYAWLRDPAYPVVEDAEILAHLAQENAWFETYMAPHKPLVDTLFEEMKGRIKEDDRSVPVRDGRWVYWREFTVGAQYRRWWRAPAAAGIAATSDSAGAECIVDEPALAAGHDYFRLGALDISPDGTRIAYAIDTNGSERYTIHIVDIASGAALAEPIPGTLGNIVFAGDNQTLLYGVVDENWRTRTIRAHVIGSAVDDDRTLYDEPDDGFSAGVSLTQSERFIILSSGDHQTSEVRLIPADAPFAEPILVAARRTGIEYDVEERGGQLFIHTNDNHINFRLATASLDAPAVWSPLIDGSDRFYMTGVTVFADYFVVEGREDGLDQIEIRYYDDAARVERIAFPEASYDAGLGENPEWAPAVLRLSYESMVTPATVYDYDVAAQTLTVRKVQSVPSGYTAADYATQRLMITARDGTLVPVSLVWRKDAKADGGNPLYLYGYGAYGIAIPPGFSTTRLSLVDRGFVYAIAHIRGGDDLGRHWYLSGKLDQRTNTFHDFIDVAQGLIDAGWTRAGAIAIAGGSAGGELVGAAVNIAPQLFGAAVANVPFVDVLNTMLDETLPLTPGEWPEWGNPITDPQAFDRIAGYCPYTNVSAQHYPPMLVTGGLNDPRVTYWEPAKWVARLRAVKTDTNPLLMKINMGAGHGGKSGRFDSLREDAEEQAFILSVIGAALNGQAV